MSYVVLDLEMCRVFNNADIRNEIIQIGAVLLDENYNMIDSFIRKLTGITNKDVENGLSLEDALNEFFEWLPNQPVLVTWSESDEAQLRVEMENKNLDVIYLDCIDWVDCQKMFGDKLNTERNYKLSEALNISCIYTDSREHDALVDAKNTARLFKKINTEQTLKLNEYYINSSELTRSSYTPFAELFKNLEVV